MNIHLHNVNLTSNSGPNCFGKKLFGQLKQKGISFDATKEADVSLVFIEAPIKKSKAPIVQRLDGIYFNSQQNYNQQNKLILETYKKASGVVFQSQFNKDLTTRYFGEHENFEIIHNGSDLELIDKIPKVEAEVFSKYDKVWCCASSWRPHKRLKDNIEYFLQHAGSNDVLLVAGEVKDKPLEDPKVKYLGNMDYLPLLRIYKSSDYFIHLAWLDHCPNVVVDARSAGCQIICSSTGGTKEIAGKNATVILEDEWDFLPTELYNPPAINFNKRQKNTYDTDCNMKNVADKYLDFMKRVSDGNA